MNRSEKRHSVQLKHATAVGILKQNAMKGDHHVRRAKKRASNVATEIRLQSSKLYLLHFRHEHLLIHVRQDKQTADFMEYMQRLEALIKGRFDSVEADIRHIKKVQSSQPLSGTRLEPDLKQETEEKYNTVSAYPGPPIAPEPQPTRSPYSSTPGPARMISEPESVNIVEHAHDQERPQKSEDEDDEDVAGIGLPEARDSTMPINHTTGAAQLLLVRPIREMCREIMKSALIKNENYAMKIEQRRGQLRLYGRGEGHDLAPDYDRRNNSDQSAGTPDDEFSNVSSPGDGGDAYGGTGGFTPPASGEGVPRVDRGVIDAMGMPDLSKDTVSKLIELYKEKMSIMHPIISNKHLDRLVETFLKSIPEDKAKSRQLTTVRTNAGFVGPPAGPPESPGTKRKRLSGSEFPDIQHFVEHKPGHPNRSMTSCIVLLCMALGRICDYNHKLPDYAVANEKDALYSMSPVMRNGHPPSPLTQSSPAISTPNAMGSPPDMERTQSRSRRTSIEGAYMPRGGLSGKPRNIDIVPGLAYFALASDILGNQLGGNDLPHVHAHILAALYHGQLGRVVESHGYLANACRAIQVLLDG